MCVEGRSQGIGYDLRSIGKTQKKAQKNHLSFEVPCAFSILSVYGEVFQAGQLRTASIQHICPVKGGVVSNPVSLAASGGRKTIEHKLSGHDDALVD